ncbi:MAG TPA: ABC transporter substrate-binding protein [Propionibacteriaceae bacterium]|nr:ABC transporter substrate-binding protein [Propionibacteriaceae bacterium]
MITAPRLAKMAAATITIGLMSVLAACGSGDPTAAPSAETSGSTGGGAKVIVGSFAFPESEILGEIYAQALTAKGIEVETKFNIGPRQQTIPALRDGSINVIPEYNGNLLAFYDEDYTERTTEEVDGALTEAVKADKLRVLKSAAAEDKDAYVVTRKTADEKGLKSIGDLSKLVPFKLGANPQFGELGYGIPGLKSVYKVGTNPDDVDFVPIEDFGGPDTVKALVDDSVQVADIYTTSPALVTEDLVVLEDPKNMIASQNIVPLVAESAYSDQLAQVLDAVSAQLTTADLIALRDRVEGKEKESADTAAKEWLTQKGLI